MCVCVCLHLCLFVWESYERVCVHAYVCMYVCMRMYMLIWICRNNCVQHLVLKCGMLKRGTEIMDLLRDSGACLIMHTGNNIAQDCDRYALHGCHGVVGKGEVFCDRVAQIYLDYVSQMEK